MKDEREPSSCLANAVFNQISSVIECACKRYALKTLQNTRPDNLTKVLLM